MENSVSDHFVFFNFWIFGFEGKLNNEDQVLHGDRVHCLPLFRSGQGSVRFSVAHLFSLFFSEDRKGK